VKRLVLALAFSSFALLCRSASAQIVTVGTNGTVSVRMAGVPLASALNALSSAAPFDELKIDAAVEQLPVTVELERVTVWEALKTILDTVGVDYLAGEQQSRIRLIVHKHVPQSDTATRSAIPSEESQRTELSTVVDVTLPEPVDASRQAKALNQTLASPPPGSPRGSGFAELPFPQTDGSPQIVPVNKSGSTSALPGLLAAPNTDATNSRNTGSPAASKPGQIVARPAPSAPQVDPQLQPLMNAPTRPAK
jgi:hypothetical protein